jgi:hypothetical protein
MSRRAVTALWIALAAFLLYAITGGGRIVGSDEVTMLELSRAMLHGHLDVPEGATLKGPDGRFYTKNAPGEAVLALPLVAMAESATRAAGLGPEKQVLALRFFVSFFNAGVAALLLGVFYCFARELGIGAAAAIGAAAMLGFTTPLWVYAKSFMAEPLQGLGLLLTLWGALRGAVSRRWPWLATTGFLLATLVKPSMGPLALLCLWPLWKSAGRRGVVISVVLVAASLLLEGLYNWGRFHNPLETGYGAQATPAAYTTPLLVGLYGLLFSSGKGLLWFAPAVWLAPAGWSWMARTGERERTVALTSVAVVALALLLYGTFEHWAGDGSFGPRYLVPLLPLIFLAVGFAWEVRGRAFRSLATVLATLGFLVQIGGVAIHFGAEMREVGDYPYDRPLNDPRFMSESHFDPHFSPIAIHWQMLLRNAGEHLHGHAPRLEAAGTPDARVGVSAADQDRLLHGLDFWWLYMSYAGFYAWPIGIALALLLALFAWAATRLGAAALREARAG